ncbi:POU domain class 2-associating factor 1 isoform X2 [Lissotriton helveticus]
MHWQKTARSDPQPQRPYQGVRVKEPVKELLKRKRGNLSSANCFNSPDAVPAATVMLPHQSIPGYSTIDAHCIDLSVPTSSLPMTDEGGLYTGWISQPSSGSLQPLAQWATCTDYASHEVVSCPYTGDMYVQPMCPTYTVVGSSSVLTYASQPLLTNFASRNTTAVIPSLEFSEQQAPITYFQPYYQPFATLPATPLQYQSPPAITGPQFVPFPFSIPDPAAPLQLDETCRGDSSIPIEKLLEENEDNETYVLNSALAVGGF